MEKFNPSILRNLIRECEVSIDDLAERTNITRSTLYNYLNGSTPITVDAVYAISNILELEKSNLFEENVLMRVLMSVPMNVLMATEKDKNLVGKKVLKRQVNSDKSDIEDKLQNEVRLLNRQIGRYELENEQLRAENGQLKEVIRKCEQGSCEPQSKAS